MRPVYRGLFCYLNGVYSISDAFASPLIQLLLGDFATRSHT